MIDHPEYDLVEFEFPLTIYLDSIEFISGKGVITKVQTKDGWKDY